MAGEQGRGGQLWLLVCKWRRQRGSLARDGDGEKPELPLAVRPSLPVSGLPLLNGVKGNQEALKHPAQVLTLQGTVVAIVIICIVITCQLGGAEARWYICHFLCM